MDCPKGHNTTLENCARKPRSLDECEQCGKEAMTVEDVFRDVLGIDPSTGELIEDQRAEFNG